MASREGRALNATALHEQLVTEHGYVGSLRSVQRYLRRRLGSGRVRARRRVGDAAGGAGAGGLGARSADVGWRSAGGIWVRVAAELLTEERGGVVGAEGHAVVVVGSRAGVFATCRRIGYWSGVLETEWEFRRRRRLEMGLKMAGLPPGRTLGNFDFAFQPTLDRTRVELLGTCGWIRERQNVLLQGPPVVGKTHLAVALGLRALENGFTVSFLRLDELLRTLKRHAGFDDATGEPGGIGRPRC